MIAFHRHLARRLGDLYPQWTERSVRRRGHYGDVGNEPDLPGGSRAADRILHLQRQCGRYSGGPAEQHHKCRDLKRRRIGRGGSASITVVAPPAISKAFSPNVISLNGNSTLTFVVGNPAGQPLNNDFEFDPDGTAIPNITGWTGNFYSYDPCGVQDNTPYGTQQHQITTARSYSGAKSVYSFVQNADLGGCGDPHGGRWSQVDLTSTPFSTSADTLYIWRSDVSSDLVPPSRWAWQFGVKLSDGVTTQWVLLACKSWGNGEDCGYPGSSYDNHDQAATGADGQTWYRHSIPIPAGLNRNNLTVTISHFQDSWDGGTAYSSLYRFNHRQSGPRSGADGGRIYRQPARRFGGSVHSCRE